MIKKVVIFFIILYQKTVSPDHGIFKDQMFFWKCAQYPSCSQYTKEAVLKEGVTKGLIKGAHRVLTCR